MLRDDVLRRPRALPLPHRGVRPVRPRQRPPARHVSQRHEVRGRDPRDGARPAPRRGRHRHHAGRPDHHRGQRQHPARDAGLPRARGGPWADRRQRRQAGDRAPCLRQGLPAARDRAAKRAGRPVHDRRRPRPDGRGDRRPDGRRRGFRLQLRIRDRRSDRGAVRARARPRRRHARRRLPRRLHPALRPGAGLRHPGVRLPAPRCHQHLGRHPQVRLRLQGHLDRALPGPDAAGRAVLPPARLERRQVHVARHRGIAVRWAARRDLGGDGPARSRGLPGLRPRHLHHGRRDEGRGGLAPRAPGGREPDVLLQLHLRLLRHLPRGGLHARPGLALQRPAVPQRDPHGGHPPADATRGGRRLRRRSRRGRGVREDDGGGREAGLLRRDLRRRPGRHGPRGGGVHRLGDGRHARRRASVPPGT